jgi:hypothetical protein
MLSVCARCKEHPAAHLLTPFSGIQHLKRHVATTAGMQSLAAEVRPCLLQGAALAPHLLTPFSGIQHSKRHVATCYYC